MRQAVANASAIAIAISIRLRLHIAFAFAMCHFVHIWIWLLNRFRFSTFPGSYFSIHKMFIVFFILFGSFGSSVSRHLFYGVEPVLPYIIYMYGKWKMENCIDKNPKFQNYVQQMFFYYICPIRYAIPTMSTETNLNYFGHQKFFQSFRFLFWKCHPHTSTSRKIRYNLQKYLK